MAGGIIGTLLVVQSAGARSHFSDCSVKMELPAPVTVGTVRTPEFPVKHKLYIILLRVEAGSRSIWDVSCLLGDGKRSFGVTCTQQPVVEGRWTVWDGTTKVAEGSVSGPNGVGETPDERELGTFEGKAKRKYAVEVTFTKDGGPLNAMHPRIVVRQDYDFWCGPM